MKNLTITGPMAKKIRFPRKRVEKKIPIQYNKRLIVVKTRSDNRKHMKVKASLKADPSKGDILVRRRGRLYVINKKDPNRKQRQKGPARKKGKKAP